MKKIINIKVLFVALIVLFAIGCAPRSDTTTLGISLSTLNNPFFVTLRDGAQQRADDLGIILVVVDAQDDSAQEAANIDDLIQQGVDALLINPTDSDAIVPSIARANEEGIPVFTIDRGATGGEVVAHVASDNIAGGELAGAFLLAAIGNAGSLVELEGIPGTSAARDRGAGFNAVVDGASDVTVVSRQTANFNRAEGLTVFENILQTQAEIDGVFAHNDEMILGAIEAAIAAGRDQDIVFVGFDAVDDALNAVQDGTLAATVAQKPTEIGALGVQAAFDYLQGDNVASYIPVLLEIIQ